MINDQRSLDIDHWALDNGHSELGQMESAPERGGRARPPGRALRLPRRSHVGTSARRKLWRRVASAVSRSERAAAQSLGYLLVQCAHGAASAADAGVPATAPLRHA